MEVPYHGDPYAEDLAAGYWTDVRKLIATRLSAARIVAGPMAPR